MINVKLLFIIFLMMSGCKNSTSGNANMLINPPNNGPTPPTKPSIQIVLKTRWTIDSSDFPGNIIYDGNKIILTVQYNFAFPNDQVTFQYFSKNLVSEGTSLSTYTGISGSYGHFTFASPLHINQQSALFWGTSSDYTAEKLSVRENSTGNLISTVNINFSNYGCSTHPHYKDPITFCNGKNFGVCVSNDRYMRLYSFDSAGVFKSATTTSILMFSDQEKMTAYL